MQNDIPPLLDSLLYKTKKTFFKKFSQEAETLTIFEIPVLNIEIEIENEIEKQSES